MKILTYFIKSLIAGAFIGIGGTIYLSCESKIAGSLLFGLGLFTIVNLGLNLFTGKIGFVDKSNFIEVIVTFFGNFAGTNLVAFLLKSTRIYPALAEKIEGSSMVVTKLNDSYLSLFVLGIFCGVLMYTAVATFRRKPDILGAIAVFLCVSVFILCGFEHCIADMYYFALVTSIDQYILPLLVITLGNSLGAIVLHKLITFYEKRESKAK